MKVKDYCVLSPAWGIQRTGLEDIPREYWIERFWVLIDFLQSHGLTVRTLFLNKESIENESKLMASDLNPQGIRVVELGLDKWSRANDSYTKYQKSGISIKPLQNALEKIQA